jgi:hypothetical protein
MNVHDYMRRLGDLLAATENIIKERDEARRERDEARREVCESEQYCVDRSREEAARRGWDCFKEETP